MTFEGEKRVVVVPLNYQSSSARPQLGGCSISVLDHMALPTPETLAGADLVVFCGPVWDQRVSAQLAGATVWALEQGSSVVFLLNRQAAQGDEPFLEGVLGTTPFVAPIPSASAANGPHHKAFHQFFTLYGQAETELEVEGEVLAKLRNATGNLVPVSGTYDVGDGLLYVIPFGQASGDVSSVIGAAIEAVSDHQLEIDVSEPAFFDHLIVPGEDELRSRIEAAVSELNGLEQKRAS
jgi:hypothetical protein